MDPYRDCVVDERFSIVQVVGHYVSKVTDCFTRLLIGGVQHCCTTTKK